MRGRLFLIDWYPGAIDDTGGDGDVIGDLYRIGSNEALLAALDDFEGCGRDDLPPHEYVRVVREIQTARGATPAFVYLYNWPTRGRRLIDGGDWLAFKKEDSSK